PNHQWTARPAYIFPLQNMILWGMGIPLGVLVWLGFLWAAWQSARGRWQRHLIPVVWSGLYFAWQGGQWVKPMRYFMPIYPTLTILGAWALIELLDWARGKREAYTPSSTELDRVDAFARAIRESRLVRAVHESLLLRSFAVGLVLAIIAAVVVATGAWGYAFSRIYTWPVTRVAASQWIMQNIPGPINIAIQQADGSVFNQPLPMAYDFFYPADVPYVTGFTAMRDGAVNTVTIAHLTDQTKSDQPQVFALSIASDPSGAPVLASATLTANLSHSADPRGDPVTLTLNKPVQMQKGRQYWIVGEASGTGEVAIAGSTIANESSWDDGLPLRLDGFDPYGGILKGENLELYWDDNQAKVELMQGVLDRSDYITISSNRQYASITRLPMRYPLTIAFYRALFGCPAPAPIDRCGAELTPANFHGTLGFDLVATFASDPALDSLRINDQMAEEPFTVYDHPKVLIFKKTAGYSSANIRALLGAVDLSKVVWMNPRQATSAPTVLMLPPDRLAEQRAGGTWSQMFDPDGILNSFHPLGVIVWWLTAVLLGWLAFPITFVALRGLPDRGYAVTRNVSLLLIAWAAWMLGSARLMPVTRLTLWLVTLAWGLLSAVVLWKRWDEIKAWVRANRQYVLRVEGLALGLFVFFLLIRFGNGDLWHGSYGGEKPMDFSYFNA
nr:hypothetical protein [Chloroflexota bacterium]